MSCKRLCEHCGLRVRVQSQVSPLSEACNGSHGVLVRFLAIRPLFPRTHARCSRSPTCLAWSTMTCALPNSRSRVTARMGVVGRQRSTLGCAGGVDMRRMCCWWRPHSRHTGGMVVCGVQEVHACACASIPGSKWSCVGPCVQCRLGMHVRGPVAAQHRPVRRSAACCKRAPPVLRVCAHHLWYDDARCTSGCVCVAMCTSGAALCAGLPPPEWRRTRASRGNAGCVRLRVALVSVCVTQCGGPDVCGEATQACICVCGYGAVLLVGRRQRSGRWLRGSASGSAQGWRSSTWAWGGEGVHMP